MSSFNVQASILLHSCLEDLRGLSTPKERAWILELLQANADPNAKKTKDTATGLWKACHSGDSDLCSIFLDFNANLLAKHTREQTTAFHEAAQNMHDADQFNRILNLMIKHLNVTDSTGQTPIFYALFNRPNLYLLLQKGADVNAKRRNNISVLHLTAESGTAWQANMLLDWRADINAQTDIDLYTPLHLAILNHQMPVIQVLLQWNANINIRDKQYRTAKAMFRQYHGLHSTMMDDHIVKLERALPFMMSSHQAFHPPISKIPDDILEQIAKMHIGGPAATCSFH